MSLALTYRTGCSNLEGLSDASWGNNPDNGKPTSGYLFMMAGGPRSFKTVLQSVTAQSTMEAELTSMALVSKEAVYLSNMMTELGFGKRFHSVPFFVDNTGALHIAGNSTYSSRTKHTALRFFFLEELVKEGRITIHHVANTKQLIWGPSSSARVRMDTYWNSSRDTREITRIRYTKKFTQDRTERRPYHVDNIRASTKIRE